MRTHYRLLSETKQQYRQIFHQHKTALEAQLGALRQQVHCNCCDGSNLNDINQWLGPLPLNCQYRRWQQAALHWLETDAATPILETLNQIEAYKNTFSCHMCGMCCRMASSDASYKELQARAATGDEFARQFTSIFLPYASRDAARQVAPDVVEAVLAEAGEEAGDSERIFFYHCPYLGEDNRCSIYGTAKRPAICSSYPETPLSFVYERCAWKPWKDDTHSATLAAHALLALCSDYAEKLKASLLTSSQPD